MNLLYFLRFFYKVSDEKLQFAAEFYWKRFLHWIFHWYILNLNVMIYELLHCQAPLAHYNMRKYIQIGKNVSVRKNELEIHKWNLLFERGSGFFLYLLVTYEHLFVWESRALELSDQRKAKDWLWLISWWLKFYFSRKSQLVNASKVRIGTVFVKEQEKKALKEVSYHLNFLNFFLRWFIHQQ